MQTTITETVVTIWAKSAAHANAIVAEHYDGAEFLGLDETTGPKGPYLPFLIDLG